MARWWTAPMRSFVMTKSPVVDTVGLPKTRLGKEIRKEPNEVQNRPIVTVVTKVAGDGVTGVRDDDNPRMG